ncbi:hypothetical protein F3Y22_tig00001818pilonHSYRG00058 [Hibiscus syriacus]|uniref:Uncharacterized protein n=1 Tax=Hibiscus syriacus TaxID=106335 RepID=A0A6A3CTQ0_HIBSY|nr:hypothetical protein F3Y22_tig00001818pilonHSYRG00058 [Hibiscus syriacus]
MEDCGNIFEKRFVGISKIQVGKPPTRLQNHAPQSLQLDQLMKPSVATTGISEAPTPIPLLTPLSLSPIPFTETDEFTFPTPKDMNAPTPTPFGWKQPIGTGFNVEASTFLAQFQNKCVIANDAK